MTATGPLHKLTMPQIRVFGAPSDLDLANGSMRSCVGCESQSAVSEQAHSIRSKRTRRVNISDAELVVCDLRGGSVITFPMRRRCAQCARQRMPLVMASREVGAEISRGGAPHKEG